MFQDKSLNLLKNMVILMSIILIIGMIVIFKMLITKLKSTTQHSCINQELQLDFGSIENITAGNGKLFLHITNTRQELPTNIDKLIDDNIQAKVSDNQKIIFFDYCNTEKIYQINLKNNG